MTRASKREVSFEDIALMPTPVTQVSFPIMIAILWADTITEILTDILIRLNLSFGSLLVLLLIISRIRLLIRARVVVGWDVSQTRPEVEPLKSEGLLITI